MHRIDDAPNLPDVDPFVASQPLRIIQHRPLLYLVKYHHDGVAPNVATRTEMGKYIIYGPLIFVKGGMQLSRRQAGSERLNARRCVFKND